ncbi:ABC transporter substrate-binding protein [Streptomyces sp. HNM0574]|uniref:heme/hemin ABC transporter substrate-binding protein n=1 Tax=Streptomyces sp. HNM0574 TaxID=2714954 RepID=UPI001F10C005|nr:ABC transporter substrate-binding protein [Streptomyces sp. HNM0574]
MNPRQLRPARSRATGALVAVLLLALLATGCGSGTSGTDGGGEKAARSAAADRVEPLAGPVPEPELPVTAESADGKRSEVRSARRIVPLSGSLSEIVFSLGLGRNVVARDVTTTFQQARKLPVVTRAHDVSAESVLSLKPSVVLAETSTGPEEAVEQIRDAGVPVVTVAPAKGLDDVSRRIDAVAGALGVEDAGRKLDARTGERLDAVRAQLPDGSGTGNGSGGKPRVAFLYLRGSASVYLLGGARSGATSLIEAAGAVDAGAESGLRKDFTPLTSEALAKAAPDVILVMRKGLESVNGVDGLLKIPGVAQTPAGMDRRVASVDDGVLLNYGPRTDRVLASLAEQIHGRPGDDR